MLPKFPNLRTERINLQFSTLLSKTNSAEGRVHATRLDRDETGRENGGGNSPPSLRRGRRRRRNRRRPTSPASHQRRPRRSGRSRAAAGPSGRLAARFRPWAALSGRFTGDQAEQSGNLASVSGKRSRLFLLPRIVVWDGVDWRVGGGRGCGEQDDRTS
jgi:hypothetical protein